MPDTPRRIRIAIAGVGNCASSLVQGIAFYARPENGSVGLQHPEIGGFGVGNLQVVADKDQNTILIVATPSEYSIIEQALDSGTARPLTSRCVVLLSTADDPATEVLDEPIRNTKTISTRRVAWTLTPRVVPTMALLSSPSSTDELDAATKALART